MIKEKVSNDEMGKSVAQLSGELNQRTEEVSVINAVQDAITKKMDMHGIYELVGNRIRDLFNAQVIGISTVNLEDRSEKFEYIVEKGERYSPDPRPLGKLRIHLVDTKTKIIINTREEGIAWFGSEVIPGTEPIKSAVFVPMLTDDKITGYITLQNIDQENAFSDADIKLLETLASSMSVALENARLFDDTNRLLKETEDLYRKTYVQVPKLIFFFVNRKTFSFQSYFSSVLCFRIYFHFYFPT
jgi:GAF domain-containing protein